MEELDVPQQTEKLNTEIVHQQTVQSHVLDNGTLGVHVPVKPPQRTELSLFNLMPNTVELVVFNQIILWIQLDVLLRDVLLIVMEHGLLGPLVLV